MDAGCYDRGAARDIPCRASVPLDCADGWRCGINAICQDRDAGAPYPCTNDTHCEVGWRCGPGLFCVDATPEALRRTPDAGTIAVAALPSTLAAPTFPVQFALSPPRAVPEASGANLHPYGVTSSTGLLTFVNVARNGVFRLSDAGTYTAVRVDRVQLPSAASSLAVSPLRAFAASASGIHRFTVNAQGGILESLPFSPGPNAGLSITSREVPRKIAAWSGDELAFFNDVDDAGIRSRTDGGSIFDFKWLSSKVPSFQATWPSVVTASGMYVAPRGASGFLVPAPGSDGGTPHWIPVKLPGLPDHLACGGATGQARLKSIWGYTVSTNDDFLLAELESVDGGEATFLLYNRLLEPMPAAIGPDCSNQFWSLESECRACGPGERPIAARTTMSTTFNLWCIRMSSDGGQEINRYAGMRSGVTSGGRIAGAPDGGCELKLASLTPGTFSTTSELDGVLFDDGSLSSTYPPLLGTMPNVQLAGTPKSGRWAFNTAGGNSSLGFIEQGFIEQGVTVRASSTLENYCGRFVGAPNYVMGRTVSTSMVTSPPIRIFDLERGEYGQMGPASATLDSSEQLIAADCAFNGLPRAAGTAAKLRDGGTLLLAGVSDRVWSVPTDRVPSDGGFTVAQVRVVPLPGLRVTALAAVEIAGQPGTDEVVAYALQGSRLFLLRAETLNRWFSNEIVVPPGDPIGIWSDGRNGRVGYADGRVFSLPLRLQIAPSLPSPAISYGSLCGHGFALTNNQLYRLVTNADGGAIGAWEPVSLAGIGLVAPFSDVQISEGRGELLLAQSGAKIARIADPSCAGP
jgi:hypothetical protein